MKRPKMIISDIDGTLTNQENISENIQREIIRIQSLGIYFTFATGRPLMMVEGILQGMKMNCPIAINSGFEIYNQNEDSLIVLDEFEISWIKKVVDYFQRQKIGVRLLKHNEIITDLKLIDKKNDNIYKRYGKYFKQLDDSLLSGIGKLNFFLKEKNKINLILDYFKKEKRFNLSVNKAYNDFVFIDILPNKLGKYCAIEKIQSSYGLLSSDCVVLVNDMNDIDLIQAADFVVAPEDALPSIKEKANLVVKNIEKNGMLNFLKNIK